MILNLANFKEFKSFEYLNETAFESNKPPAARKYATNLKVNQAVFGMQAVHTVICNHFLLAKVKSSTIN